MLKKQSYTFPVRAYEVGQDGKLTMANMCNYLQEAAGLHAHELHVALHHLTSQGITWVLARLHVKMKVLPTWQDEIIIETWPAQIDRIFAIRDFKIMCRKEEIGVATSAWALIDLKTRKSLRSFPEVILDLHPQEPVRSLADPFSKMVIPDTDQCENYAIRYADVDINHHVNNVVYINLLTENAQSIVKPKASFKELEIEFRGEAFCGDVLTARVNRNGNRGEFIHSLINEKTATEVIRARSVWQETQ